MTKEIIFLILKVFGVLPFQKTQLLYPLVFSVCFTILNIYIKINYVIENNLKWYKRLYTLRTSWECSVLLLNVFILRKHLRELEKITNSLDLRKTNFHIVTMCLIFIKEFSYYILNELHFAVDLHKDNFLLLVTDTSFDLMIVEYSMICILLSTSISEQILEKENPTRMVNLYMRVLEDLKNVQVMFERQSFIISVRLGAMFVFHLNHIRKEVVACQAKECGPWNMLSMFDRLTSALWQLSLLLIFTIPAEDLKKMVSTNK